MKYFENEVKIEDIALDFVHWNDLSKELANNKDVETHNKHIRELVIKTINLVSRIVSRANYIADRIENDENKDMQSNK